MSFVPKLRKIILKYILRKNIVSYEKYSAYGEESNIFWYRDSGDLSIAKYIPFLGAVLINKDVIEDTENIMADYVFLHEIGHKNATLIVKILTYPALFISVLLMVAIPLMYITVVFPSLLINQQTILYENILGLFVVSFLGILIYSPTRHIMEFQAEYYAIKRIGKENYLRCQEERNSESKDSIMLKLRRFLEYPSPKRIVWFYEFRN